MKGIFGTISLICLVNLVPFIMTVFMLVTNETSNLYSVFLSIRSLFSIPTSLIGFALQYDLGEVWWIILNMLGLGIGIAALKG